MEGFGDKDEESFLDAGTDKKPVGIFREETSE